MFHLIFLGIPSSFFHSILIFLYCRHFSLQRQTLMNYIKSIDKGIINETDSDLVNILLFGSSKYQYHINSKILTVF